MLGCNRLPNCKSGNSEGKPTKWRKKGLSATIMSCQSSGSINSLEPLQNVPERKRKTKLWAIQDIVSIDSSVGIQGGQGSPTHVSQSTVEEDR